MNTIRNKVTLIGNLGNNPEIKLLDNNKKLARLSIATNETYKNQKGEWQEPLNLGDTINTAGEDMCWAFSPDGKKMHGSGGPLGSYNHDVMWLNKDDIPLLKNFEPIGPPPNLLAK